MTGATRHKSAPRHSIVEGEFPLTRADFRTLADLLRAQTGITLQDAKATLLYSRLAKRLRALGLTDFSQYCALLSQNDAADERDLMIRSLTTNVTRFFREPHHFTYLAEAVLPKLLRAAERGDRVRLWSAACSTGQEPYSIAMTVLRLLPAAGGLDVRVLATDIDTEVLRQASIGLYTADGVASLPADLLKRWFEPADGGYRVGTDVRKLVSFKAMNLIQPFPVRGPFDAIFCRNVVIYFDEEQQQAIWSRLAPLLSPAGTLFVGHSERVTGPAAAGLHPVGVTTYQRQIAQ